MYLKAKYFKIYVDEYQDCDKDLHALFMYICEILNIDTFVVGDEKQSIYMWRGAYPKAFMSIWDREDFSKTSYRYNRRLASILSARLRDLRGPNPDLGGAGRTSGDGDRQSLRQGSGGYHPQFADYDCTYQGSFRRLEDRVVSHAIFAKHFKERKRDYVTRQSGEQKRDTSDGTS